MRIDSKKQYSNPNGLNKKKFAVIWFMAFSVLFTTSSVLGLVPKSDDKPVITNEALADVEQNEEEILAEVPLRIKSDAIGLNTPVLNPESADIAVLDGELAKGAVRYPGSGIAGENSNMFIFGHSSQLPVVNNKAYKAFNNIEKLRNGDEIIVQTENQEFIYEVVRVKGVKAQEVVVEFDSKKPMLTLSTCNTFENFKEDRFVVEAELKEVVNK